LNFDLYLKFKKKISFSIPKKFLLLWEIHFSWLVLKKNKVNNKFEAEYKFFEKKIE
jgi:hypothetical protein